MSIAPIRTKNNAKSVFSSIGGKNEMISEIQPIANRNKDFFIRLSSLVNVNSYSYTRICKEIDAVDIKIFIG